MWPRLVSRGDKGMPQNFNEEQMASMWPRLVSRGDVRVWPLMLLESRLQCGRGLLAAETDKPRGGRSICRRLQCGRGLLAAETEALLLRAGPFPAASMWPRL